MSRRTDKLAKLIQVNLAELINYRLADPRIKCMVTVTGVDLAPDLRQAVVLFTAVGDSEAQLRTLARALRHAAGRLGFLLAERLQTKTVPRLDIRIDEQAVRTRRTLEAIQQAMQQVRPQESPPSDEPEESADE